MSSKRSTLSNKSITIESVPWITDILLQVLAKLILTAITAVQATSERRYLAVRSGTTECI